MDTVQPNINPDLLPRTAREIAEVIGYPAMMELVEAYGGVSLSLSQGLTPSGQASFAAMAEVIGVEAARALARHFRRERLSVPRCTAARCAIRDDRLRADYDELTRAQHWTDGAARAHLAIKYHTTDRHVSRLLKQSKE